VNIILNITPGQHTTAFEDILRCNFANISDCTVSATVNRITSEINCSAISVKVSNRFISYRQATSKDNITNPSRLIDVRSFTLSNVVITLATPLDMVDWQTLQVECTPHTGQVQYWQQQLINNDIKRYGIACLTSDRIIYTIMVGACWTSNENNC
jgi:hypothetical protein